MVASLQAFDAAIALGSFKAAADVLHVTPSAISHRLRRLEAALGSRLFERRNRGVRATAAGEDLSAMTRRGFAELARAMERGAGSSPPSALKISVFPLFASAWLLPRVGDFIARHPDIELSISSSTRLADLETEAVDAVVRSGAGQWPGLTAIPLMRLQTTLLAAPQAVRRLGLREPRDVAGAPLIQMSRFPNAWPDWFSRQALDWTKPRRTVWVEGFEAAMLAAERGVGVALSLWPLCAPSIDAGHLVEVLPVRVDATNCWLAYRASDAAHSPLNVFKKWLREELRTISR